MIKSDRQYRITRAQAVRFRRAIKNQQAAPPDPRIRPKVRQALLDALRSQLEDLQEQLAEYEALRSRRRRRLPLKSWDDLPRTLIRARIAAGWSQAKLAQHLGVKPQQVQRYEATDYQSASLAKVAEVARTLGLKLHTGEARLPPR
jgi:ribosome-binding protein aMBF1 (putative translation factor)